MSVGVTVGVTVLVTVGVVAINDMPRLVFLVSHLDTVKSRIKRPVYIVKGQGGNVIKNCDVYEKEDDKKMFYCDQCKGMLS